MGACVSGCVIVNEEVRACECVCVCVGELVCVGGWVTSMGCL